MKELTKKILESGIVDRTITKMMERWGMIEPSDYALEVHEQQTREDVVRETLDAFIEELELLTQPEAIERQETRLDPPAVLVDRTRGD